MHRFFLAVCKDFSGYLCYEEVQTNNEAFHLVLSNHIDVQDILHPVVELEGSSTSGHNAQVRGFAAVQGGLLLLQLLYEVDAQVDSISFKIEEVESSPSIGRT